MRRAVTAVTLWMTRDVRFTSTGPGHAGCIRWITVLMVKVLSPWLNPLVVWASKMIEPGNCETGLRIKVFNHITSGIRGLQKSLKTKSLPNGEKNILGESTFSILLATISTASENRFSRKNFTKC